VLMVSKMTSFITLNLSNQQKIGMNLTHSTIM
jgi:hypothetical protein